MDSVAAHRQLSQNLSDANLRFPLWIRNAAQNFIHPIKSSADNLLETSLLSGSLLCDGIGDLVSVEEEPSLLQATNLGYNALQATRTRISKTEFVACPSCGRTLFDLETTTQKVKAKTDHLKGITIAVMGCIVNGPGEMADADFGYVGGAPGKINLYVGKDCVQAAIPEAEAVNRLIDLIKAQGKWREPGQAA
jgi:(E)-4-hydroxy-3-methylbut-2-enyl-diphosphate synthase